MTVSKLRQELTEAELYYYAAYFEVKVEKEKEEQRRQRLQANPMGR